MRLHALLLFAFINLYLPVWSQNASALVTTADSLLDNRGFKKATELYKMAQKTFLQNKDWDKYLYCQRQISQALLFEYNYKAGEDTLRNGMALYENVLVKLPNPPLEQYCWLRLFYTGVLAVKGRSVEANELMHSLLKEIEATMPQNYEILGRIHVGFALNNYNIGDYLNTEKHAVSAIEYYANQKKPDWLNNIYAHLALVRSQIKLCNFEGALETLQQLEKLRPENNSSQKLRTNIQIFTEQGSVYQGLGNYTRALDYFTQVLTLCQKVYGNKDQNTVKSFLNIGNVHRLRQEYESALKHYQLGLSAVDSLYVTSKAPNQNRVMLLSYVAECYSNQGEWIKAVQYWQNAIREAEKLESKRLVPLIRESLAKFYLKNNNPQEALAELEAAEVLLAPQEKARFIDLCRVRALAARALNMLGQHRDALNKVQQALLLQCRQGTTLNNYDNPTEDRLILSENITLILSVKAEILYNFWMSSGGSTDLLSQSLRTTQLAIQISERLRYFYRVGGQDEDTEWIQEYKALFIHGVSSAHQLFTQTKDRAYLHQAFSLADRNKVISKTGIFQDSEAKIFAGIPSTLLQRESQLSREIVYCERKIVEAPDRATAQKYEAQLFERKQDLDKLVAQMERDYPYYLEQKYRPRIINVRDIQSQIDEKTIFVEYLADAPGKKIYIFVIEKSAGLNIVAIPLSEGAVLQLEAFNVLLQSADLPEPAKRQQFIQLSQRLYQQYLQPLADYLANKQKIVFVSDALFRSLPFEALISDNKVQPFNALPYLIRRLEVSYAYSGASFVFQLDRQTGKSAEGITVFAPGFDPKTVGTNVIFDTRFAPLPSPKNTASEVVKNFGSEPTQMLLERRATEPVLKVALTKAQRIVHIDSYYFSDVHNLRFAGIACFPVGGNDNPEDNVLYINELGSQSINADLIFIAYVASKPKTSVPVSGETHSIDLSLIQAGATNVIYPVWSATRDHSNFILDFYRHLKTEKSYAAALRKAKLTMLSTESTAVPSQWCGWFLIGY